MLLHAILLLGSLAAAETARPCETSLIRGVTTEEVIFDLYDAASGRVRVRCAQGNSSQKAIKLHSGSDTLHSNLYDSLSCDAKKGWTGEGWNGIYGKGKRQDYIAHASSPVTISCPAKYAHCDPSLIKGLKADEVEFSIKADGERVLSCVHRNTYLTGMNSYINGVADWQLESLRCDQNGWFEYAAFGGIKTGKLGSKLADLSQMTFSCVEYCGVVSETGLNIRHKLANFEQFIIPTYNEVTCADKSLKLFYNGQRVEAGRAVCGMDNGWGNYYGEEDVDHPFKPTEKSAFTKQRLECRSDSHGKRSSRASRTAEGKQEE